METEGEFRVIDTDTGRPRPKGTEGWSEETYAEWKRQGRPRRTVITYQPLGWVAVLLTALALLAYFAREAGVDRPQHPAPEARQSSDLAGPR
jgi:hypothetical protein